MKNSDSIVSLEKPTMICETGPAAANLTSGRVLARNTIWNLVGVVLPISVAIFCLPVLKTKLGTDRLGILSLAWVVLGYFGFFDLGLSRALTKLVAERLGQKRDEEIPALIWTSLSMMAGLGIVSSLVVFLIVPWMVLHPLKIPQELRPESIRAFYWIGFSIPVVIVTAGLRGVLEALQRFRLATVIRIPMGIFTYLGPVLVLPFSHSLVAVMAILVIGRVLACAAHFWGCFYAVPSLGRNYSFHAASIGPLFRFGSWMTVSNVVSPLMVSFDRFLIGALISVSAVAYYAVPYEVVTKLGLVPMAVVGVLFPAFSTTVVSDRERLISLYNSGTKYIFFALFPCVLVLITFAPEALQFWLGSDFARQSARVAQILGIAVFINGIGQIPFAHVQGAGRPDITAKLHLIELPVYALTLFGLAKTLGIHGVAIAWLLRVSIDTGLLFVFSRKLLPENDFLRNKFLFLIMAAFAAFGAALFLDGWVIKGAFVIITCSAVTASMWRWLFSPREKMILRGGFRGDVTA